MALFSHGCCHIPRPSVSPTVALLPHELLPFYLANCGSAVVLCARLPSASAQVKQVLFQDHLSYEPLPFCLTNCSSSVSRTVALLSPNHELWPFSRSVTFLTNCGPCTSRIFALQTFRNSLSHEVLPFCLTNVLALISHEQLPFNRSETSISRTAALHTSPKL